ncbi:hypothetical protein HUA74_18380 [Myxococcus sp. CA051A]|uniref:hypothetical protein n=1 Tax=Myxococcus sp. CA051A TaxID=2741739 RepID=UPI00157AF58F|nr:hypothetical protein [Myxococcus sp. CA051A]NTX62622.1 hypothetical protein [Myxococcus sp. CA051A]
MPMTTTVPFEKGEQILTRDVGFKQKEMEAPDGTVTDAIVVRFLCDVSAGGVVAALTEPERLQVLSGFKVSLKQFLPDGSTLEPWQMEPLDRVRDDSVRWLKQDVDNFEGATDGLARAYASGSQQVNFTCYIPTGHAAVIAESHKFTGLSPEQLKDCTFNITKDGDPFKTAKSTLTLTAVKVIMSPGTKKSEARRIGVPVFARRVVNANGYEIKTEPGLCLSLEDMTPYASTTLGALRVTAGGVTVTNDPSTKVEIFADLVRDYASAGRAMDAKELGINARRTLVYGVSPNALTRIYTGVVEARQIVKNKEWEGRALYLPLLSHAQTMALIKGYSRHIPDGRVLHAVSTGMYEGLEVDDKALPYTGMTLFLDNEPDFPSYAGIRCEKGGTPYVYVPDHRLRAAALKVVSVMRRSDSHPAGDTRMARAIVLDEARWVPAAVTSTRGFDEMSAVREEVAMQIRAATARHDEASSLAVI